MNGLFNCSDMCCSSMYSSLVAQLAADDGALFVGAADAASTRRVGKPKLFVCSSSSKSTSVPFRLNGRICSDMCLALLELANPFDALCHSSSCDLCKSKVLAVASLPALSSLLAPLLLVPALAVPPPPPLLLVLPLEALSLLLPWLRLFRALPFCREYGDDIFGFMGARCSCVDSVHVTLCRRKVFGHHTFAQR